MRELRMARRVPFSAGHRYWLECKTPEQNRTLFGPWASRFNHGHNYVLDVLVAGEVDASTGMIVNIKAVDDVLKAGILKDFHLKSLNDEVPEFQDRTPTLENLLLVIQARLNDLPPESRHVGSCLEEMPTLYAELEIEPTPTMTLTRIYEFAASHRLHSPSLSDDKNLELFGKCNNANGHGHNYVLEVTVSGEPDSTTGMMVDIGALDATVHREVVDRYDHRNLNLDLPEFQGRPTTSEVVAAEIFDRLKKQVPATLARVRLWETARNMFEVTA